MASTISIISDGTTYHLTTGGGARQFYAGTGTPWTSASTTPYEIQMSEMGKWTPQAAKRIDYWSGGPPFRNGRMLVGGAYDTVEETIPIAMAATSYNFAVKLLRQLRQILNTARHTIPAVLAVKPNGATVTSYFEILSADVQETPAFINDNARGFQSPQSKGELFATITLRRTPMAGQLGTSITQVLAAQTFTNQGTGANPNISALASTTDDLPHDGVPMNIRFKASATNNARIYLATIDERLYSTASAGARSTSSVTGALQYIVPFTLSNEPYAHSAVRGRVLLRFSALAANTRLRVRVTPKGGGGGAEAPLYTSRWITPPVAGATLVDMGGFSLEAMRRSPLSGKDLAVSVYQKSSDGLSATMTNTYAELLTYYTFCQVDCAAFFGANYDVRINAVQERADMVGVPMPPTAGHAATGTTLYDLAQIRGTVPKYYSGASLYAAWLSSTYTHSTSDTAVITALAPVQALTLQAPT